MTIRSQDTTAHATSGRIASLDLLRFAAAFAVLAFHYLYRGAISGGFVDQSYGEAGEIAMFGYLGVNLFFMISGFVIIWSANGRGWYEFTAGRVIRLYPAHLVAMTLTALLVVAWAKPPFAATLPQWFANLTMMAPLFGQKFIDGAYWSIVLEIIFYFWVAVGLMTGLLPRHTERCVAAWMAIILVNTFAVGSHALELLFVTRYGACFCLGIMAWRLLSAGPSRTRLALLGLALALTFLTASLQRQELLEHYGQAASAPATTLANAFVAAIFLMAVFIGRDVRLAPWMLALGGISYPLYLIHQNAGYIVINAAAPLIGRWPAALLAAMIVFTVAWGIWRFAEPAGRKLLRALLDPLGRWIPGSQTQTQRVQARKQGYQRT